MTEEEFRMGTNRHDKGYGLANEPAFDYAAAAEKTNSIVFNPQYVFKRHFNDVLAATVENAEKMNLLKKLFFRGRSPFELGMLQPEVGESMKLDFDGISADEVNIIHGIIGVITEAGEMAELLLAFVQGISFDPVHLLEESGDVEWYQHRILAGIKATAELRNRANIDKLHGRHGEAFDVFRDAHRDLANERRKLEVAAAPLLEQQAGASDPVALPPRVRNDPPLPPGVAPVDVGNGGENIGDAPD